MEEISKEHEIYLEDLSKEERKLLHKEFRKSVGTRFKIFLWIGLALLLPALISGGFSLYYMIDIAFSHVVSFQLYICAAAFTIGCSVSLLLTSQYHKKFIQWLKEFKSINIKAGITSKNNRTKHL